MSDFNCITRKNFKSFFFFCKCLLTLEVPITTAEDDIHKYFFIVFQKKIRLDVSKESSAGQRIHMKIKPYFLREIKSKNQNVCCNFCLAL